MSQIYDEFSTYTTYEDIEILVDKLIESGIEDDYEIFDKCVERFGKYFTSYLPLLIN